MMETDSRWNDAALDGLLLSLVTIAANTFNALLSLQFLAFVFWGLKTFFSVWLLYRFMKRFASRVPDGSVFGYGVMVSMFSSIVCAAYSFAYYRFLFTDKLAEAMDQARALLEVQNVPEESMDALNAIEANAAQISCVATLIWCFILGVIISAILRNPVLRSGEFPDDNNSDDEEI